MRPFFSMSLKMVFCVSVLTAITSAQTQDQKLILATWKSCAQCHAPSETQIPADADWLKLIATTQCVSGDAASPKHRTALVRYLESRELSRPNFITSGLTSTSTRAHGELLVPATSGSAYLLADAMTLLTGGPPSLRLYWKESAKGQKLRVPTGNYRVISYAFYRTDKKKARWTLSGTSESGCANFQIAKDSTTLYPLRPRPVLKLDASRTPMTVAIKFTLADANNHRMTVARGGQLITPKWRVEDQRGQAIGRGRFTVF